MPWYTIFPNTLALIIGIWVYLVAIVPITGLNIFFSRWEKDQQEYERYKRYNRVTRNNYVPRRYRRPDLLTIIGTYARSLLSPAWDWFEHHINALDTRAYRVKRYRNPRFYNKAHAKHYPRRNYKAHRLLRTLAAYERDIRCYTSTTKAKQHRRHVLFDSDSIPIGIDNRATRCISSYKSDFVGQLTPIQNKIRGLTGITQGQNYMGTIRWTIEDDQGQKHQLDIPSSIYCPEVKIRLFSPQHWAQTAGDHTPCRNGTLCITHADNVVLEWNQRKYRRTLPLNTKGNNVADLYTAPGFSNFCAFDTQLMGLDTDDTETNLAHPHHASSVEEGEIYHTHHLSEGASNTAHSEGDPGTPEGATVGSSSMSRPTWDPSIDLNGPVSPDIPIQEDSLHPADTAAEFLYWHHRMGHCSYPKIRLMARQGILPSRLADCRAPTCTSCIYGKMHRRPWRGKSRQDHQTREASAPGEIVSVDQLVSRTPGLIAQLRGIPTTKRYTCATIFVDQYSKFGYIHLQKSTGAIETVEAKKAFEAMAATHGVRVRQYHADNGIFADNAFRKAVHDEHQRLTFCGVNAHFQNGVAEKRIRDITEQARTMLIHANRRWSDAITHHLWPYALNHSNEVINNTPLIKHTENKTPTQLFSGSDININPKHWAPFGCPTYVLNDSLAQQQVHPKWNERARVGINLGFSKQHARSVALVLSLHSGLVSPQFHISFDHKFETMNKAFDKNPPKSLWQRKCHFLKGYQHPKPSDHDLTDMPTRVDPAANERELTPLEGQDTHAPEGDNAPASEGEQLVDIQEQQSDNTVPIQPLRRSTRRRTKTQRLIEVFQAKMELVQESFVAFEACAHLPIEATPSELYAYKATSDPDTLYLHEAMNEPDREKFIEAMLKEVRDQEDNGNWVVKNRKDIPSDATILPAVWAFRRKRRITTQEVYKWKARLNLDGSKMIEGVHYDQTYSPLASWGIIRLALVLAAINGWHSKQIDFVQAFPQSPVERDNIYMKIPKGFELPNGMDPREYVLHIKKNVYGGKAAGRVWNKYLVEHLKKVGFKQSKYDECVFYYKSTLYILYCDDSILTGPNKAEIEEAFQQMKKSGLDVTDEGDVGDFLGVRIDKLEDGSIHLSQPHLIDSILKDLKMQDTTATKPTPALVKRPLFRHLDSPAFDKSFDYRSLVGKLGYLETTRPDLAYANHACARFCSNPREPHGKAIRHIGRYLAGTRDKGTILKPNLEESFRVYVDADFAGNYDQDDTENTDTARSRTGYIISYAGCPLYWKSSLQTEISLSSTESEYISISEALRSTIPMMNIIDEMSKNGFAVLTDSPIISCRVFEDNSGAIAISNNPKFRPRTKHLNVKYHFFRQYITSGHIKVEKIDTLDQPADYLTKSLEVDLFQKHRLKIQGW